MNDFHRRLEEEIPPLRRYARALTRNVPRADDLLQETLARALRKEHLWQPGTDLRAWLFTIMHNQNVNEIRHAMRDGGTVDIGDCSAILIATTDPTASRQLRELDHALWAASGRTAGGHPFGRARRDELRGSRSDPLCAGRDNPLAPVARPRGAAQAHGYRSQTTCAAAISKLHPESSPNAPPSCRRLGIRTHQRSVDRLPGPRRSMPSGLGCPP